MFLLNYYWEWQQILSSLFLQYKHAICTRFAIHFHPATITITHPLVKGFMTQNHLPPRVP